MNHRIDPGCRRHTARRGQRQHRIDNGEISKQLV